jgi:hypothetical protein
MEAMLIPHLASLMAKQVMGVAVSGGAVMIV